MMDDRGKVAEELRVPPALIDMYSFPQVFTSTAGPFGGIGGAAMTSMQIYAYTDGIYTVFFCNGKRVKCIKNWQPSISMP